MKKMFLFVISVALLLLTVGCNKVEEPPSEATPDSAIEEEQNPVESAIYRFTAEVVKYGNDALYVKVIDAGDSTLSIDDELYVGVANGYDDYPIGCTVEVAYSSEVIVDDYGIGRTLSVFNVEESPSEATPDAAIEEETMVLLLTDGIKEVPAERYLGNGWEISVPVEGWSEVPDKEFCWKANEVPFATIQVIDEDVSSLKEEDLKEKYSGFNLSPTGNDTYIGISENETIVIRLQNPIGNRACYILEHWSNDTSDDVIQIMKSISYSFVPTGTK